MSFPFIDKVMTKHVVITLLAVLLAASCKTDKPAPAAVNDKDTAVVASDTLPADTTMIAPPKKADGLFDDFVYSFMRNPKYQKQRIKFPLLVNDHGKQQFIAANAWHYDKMYLRNEVYTIIFDSEASVKAEKDTSLDSVAVEWVYLKRREVKQYRFHRIQGEWFLTEIVKHALSENINSDFYLFYDKFASDHAFQLRHVNSTINFKTFDEDNFEPIEGVLDAQQWPDFRPELPQGTITNINYGQHYGNGNRRVLMVCTPSGGMGCSLTFQRKKSGWTLMKLVN